MVVAVCSRSAIQPAHAWCLDWCKVRSLEGAPRRWQQATEAFGSQLERACFRASGRTLGCRAWRRNMTGSGKLVRFLSEWVPDLEGDRASIHVLGRFNVESPWDFSWRRTHMQRYRTSTCTPRIGKTPHLGSDPASGLTCCLFWVRRCFRDPARRCDRADLHFRTSFRDVDSCAWKLIGLGPQSSRAFMACTYISKWSDIHSLMSGL
mmetsp:Transcript_61795/g.201616  ORF Transcript_61795/g.201616 Transcript_61795/m.201616 type:complete len:207 (-) Transcript_61795:176-796(-)